MSKSKYAIRMARLSDRIFGQVPSTTAKKDLKLIKMFSGLPAHLNPEIVNYYPKHRELFTLMNGLRYHGLYRDEAADFKQEMIRRLEVRGRIKPPPEHLVEKQEASLKRREEALVGEDKRVNITS